MYVVTLLLTLLLLQSCTPSDSYRPAAERVYDSAEPPTTGEDTASASADSIVHENDDEGNTGTEEIILHSR